MKILGYTGQLVNQNLLPHIPKKHHPLFIFGLTAFTVNSFVSLASNARQVGANVHTAASKVYRLTSNQRLLSDLRAGQLCRIDYPSESGQCGLLQLLRL